MERAFASVLSKRSRISVVCLLHEDFPVELPIFGSSAGAPAPAEGAGEEEEQDDTHVLMVMGTVRDMTPEEEKALVKVCSHRGVGLVGRNLRINSVCIEP